MNREWAIPVALGLVVAAGLWVLPDGHGDDPDDGSGPTSSGSSGASSSGPNALFLAPFAESRGEEGEETAFLVVTPRGRVAAQAELNETGIWNFTAEDLDWVNDRVAYYEPENVAVGCHPQEDGATACADPYWAFFPWPLPKAIARPEGELGPRLGLDGYNATRATIYVFDERGLLAATNDEESNHTRFPGAPTTMEPAVWYIGANGTAPEGTQKPPSFAAPLVQKLRPLMEGLPVGGVASTQSNAYVSLYGTLFITIRIDELVHAP